MQIDVRKVLQWLKIQVVGNNNNNADDGGIQVDQQVPLTTIYLAGTPGGTGAALGTYLTNSIDLKPKNGYVNAGSFQLTVPRDYDSNSDQLAIRFQSIKAGAGSDTPNWTVAAYSQNTAGTITTTTTTNYNAALTGPIYGTAVGTNVVTGSNQEFIFNFNGNGWVRDQILTFNLIPGGNTTSGQEPLIVGPLEISYRSTITGFVEGVDQFGIEWR